MTFEQAKQIAKKCIPKVNICHEYPDVYMFFIERPTQNEVWDNEVVIRKKDGKIISYTHFVMTSNYAEQTPLVRRL